MCEAYGNNPPNQRTKEQNIFWLEANEMKRFDHKVIEKDGLFYIAMFDYADVGEAKPTIREDLEEYKFNDKFQADMYLALHKEVWNWELEVKNKRTHFANKRYTF